MSVKAWYRTLDGEVWFAATMMLEFAMRNGDVLRLKPENFVERGEMRYLNYVPHKTELTSGRRVFWPIHDDIWAKIKDLGGVAAFDLTDDVFSSINKAMRSMGFSGSKGAYELRKICIDHIYQKYGVVGATSAMETTTDLFWLTLAQSLFKNFKRTFSPLLEIGLLTAGDSDTVNTTKVTSITYINGVWKVNGNKVTPGTTYKGIAIIEKSLIDEWVLGTAKLETINFEVLPTTVYDGTQDIIWGVTETVASGTTIGNGYDTADLEYFCMGERGDQYRKQMWPNNIDTKYFVNPEGTYYYLDITYAYAGDCEDNQNSKKVMTIVSPTKGTITSLITALGISVDKTTNFGE